MVESFKKGSQEFEMFADFYAIVKNHWIPEDTIEYQMETIHSVNDFAKNMA